MQGRAVAQNRRAARHLARLEAGDHGDRAGHQAAEHDAEPDRDPQGEEAFEASEASDRARLHGRGTPGGAHGPGREPAALRIRVAGPRAVTWDRGLRLRG